MAESVGIYFEDHKDSRDLGRLALRGGVVSVAMQYGNGVLQIVAAIVLARLLAPEDFGLVAIVTVLTSFAPLLIDFGLGDATAQRSKITRSQISGGGHTPPADWYPSDHPVMPKLVAAGDAGRGITACAACHYPNGKGRPQNANLAGLNADYLARQLREMKTGLRRTAEPRKHNAQQMLDFAKAMTEPEIAQAAAQVAVRLRGSAMDCDGPPNELDGSGRSLRLQGQHAEQMHRIEVARFDSQQLLADLLGLGHRSTPVQVGRASKQFSHRS